MELRVYVAKIQQGLQCYYLLLVSYLVLTVHFKALISLAYFAVFLYKDYAYSANNSTTAMVIIVELTLIKF